MPELYVTYVRKDDESNITVFKKGDDKPYVAHFTHPNWDLIVERALKDDPTVIDLFDIAGTIHDRFKTLSERVTVYNGEIFLDGDKMDGALADQIVRFLRDGVTDWIPLVAFFENLQSNPSQRSRDGLYRWLKTHRFSITDDGLVVGYKGVHKVSTGPSYESDHAGNAVVDGVPYRNVRIPNKPGSIVSIPRSEVRDDPHQACAVGLHVANWDFAKSFLSGQGTVTLEVHVNPRDVVSIPTDSSDAKMRVCRYLVVQAVTKPYARPVVASAPRGSDLTADMASEDPADDVIPELVDPSNAAPAPPPNPFPTTKNPSHSEWGALVARSKSRRQSIKSLAGGKGWVLTDSNADPKRRQSWSVR